MIHIAICDDEKFFREQIKEILKQYMDDKGYPLEIDTFCSGIEFIEQGIEMVKYKIIFLDIYMEQLDGMMTAKEIRKRSKEMFIVFITACIQCVFEGYKVDAVRYILKNDGSMAASIYECMDAILEKMNYQAPRVRFDFREGAKKVSLEHILYIESKLHKLEVYIMEDQLEKYTLLGTLNKLEAFLKGDGFLRVHQSFLVNMRFIKRISRYKAVFRRGRNEEMEVNIPRARYNNVEEHFISYRASMEI